MGRQDDAIAIAERPEVIFTTFGDMMRVPASNGSLLDAKARGADVRMVYSPLDALKIARENPDRAGRLLRDRLRDHRPLDRDHAAARPRRGHRKLLGLLQPRHDHPGDAGDPRLARPAPRRLHRPGPCLHRDRPAPVPLRRRGAPKAGGRLGASSRSTSSRAVHMLLRQLAEGRCEVENQYQRVVAPRGQPARAGGDRPDDGVPHHLRVARARLHLPAARSRSGAEFAAWDAEVRYEVPGVRVADPKACQCGEVLKGVIKPWECKVFGTACTPEHPIGTCMVSSEGACAAYYNYGRHAGGGGAECRGLRRRSSKRSRRAVAARAARSRDETDHAQPRRRRQGLARPDRGHLPARVLDNELLAPLGDSAPGRHRQGRSSPLRPTPTSSARSSSPAATSASSPSTARSTTWRWPARRRSPSRRASSSRRVCRSPTCERIAESMARAAERADVRIVTGDTKVVERGKADGLYINTSGVGVVEHEHILGPRAVRPGDKVLVSGPIGDHGMAVMIARGELALEVELESDTAPLNGLVDVLLNDVVGRPLPARPDPRRPSHGPHRAGPDRRGRHHDSRSPRSRSAARSRAPARSSASTRSTSRTRAS